MCAFLLDMGIYFYITDTKTQYLHLKISKNPANKTNAF